MSKFRIYAISIIIPILVGGFIGLITSNATIYNTLEKPFLSPPSILFPIVWTILYTLMGISYGILKSNSLLDSTTNTIYYLQLFVNALWSIFFFTLEWRLFAFFWLILLLVLVILMIINFYKKNKIAGLLQLPYLLWISFALYLNLATYLLNR